MLEEKGDDAGMADSMVSLPSIAALHSLAKVLYWGISGGDMRLLQVASDCVDVRAAETASAAWSSAACHTSPVSLDTAIFSLFLQTYPRHFRSLPSGPPQQLGPCLPESRSAAERRRRWRCRATPGSCGTLRSSAS